MKVIGNIAGFESMGTLDGPGVRFVVFMQGCPIRCAYCHNPEMWDKNLEKIKMTPEELLSKVMKYKPYFENGGGVTVSGGEPLLQEDFVTEFFKLCKECQIHTCLDTSGQGGNNYKELLEFCDLVILDVKELDSKKYLDLTGKNDEEFYKFLETCKNKNVAMWFRQVIMPGYNDNESDVKKLKSFAEKYPSVKKVELLPYHSMAKKKYEQLGISYKLSELAEMDKQKCKELEKILKK